MTRVLGTTRRQKEIIEKEKELYHHIPTVLVNKISRLANVRHRDELRRFARDYKNRPFENLTEEYEYVKTSISNLLDMFFPGNLIDIIERDMRTSLAAGILEHNIRESFIHPFQVFLVGSVIIDKFYQSFQQWYSNIMCTSNETCLESAWLLAAIFHDRAKNVNVLRETLEPEIGEYGDKLPDEDVYIDLISSFYDHKLAGNPLQTWDSSITTNPAIENVFKDYSERWSHGIKGAILMLRLICTNPANVTPRDVASAFAISVHHHDVWDDLRTSGIFPLDMNRFPLACLLLQLDAVQEWGRRQIVSSETRLVGFSITDRSVNFDLVFESGTTLGDKYEECQKAKHCIRSPSLNIYSDMNVRTRLSI